MVLPEDPKAKPTAQGDVSLDAIKSLALSGVAGGYQTDATLNADKPKGDEAHALTRHTLTDLKRLLEVVEDGDGKLSIVLAGHPKLGND